MDQALSRIERIEEETSWADKIDKAVWRGTAWYNSVANRDLRPSLVLKSKGKEWADVQTLAWHNNAEDASNAIAIHDFCKYKFIIYTEVSFNMIWDAFTIVECLVISLLKFWTFLGNNVLRASSVPSSLRIRDNQSTNRLSSAHYTSCSSRLLNFVPPTT
jgi:hypothetical protein